VRASIPHGARCVRGQAGGARGSSRLVGSWQVWGRQSLFHWNSARHSPTSLLEPRTRPSASANVRFAGGRGEAFHFIGSGQVSSSVDGSGHCIGLRHRSGPFQSCNANGHHSRSAAAQLGNQHSVIRATAFGQLSIEPFAIRESEAAPAREPSASTPEDNCEGRASVVGYFVSAWMSWGMVRCSGGRWPAMGAKSWGLEYPDGSGDPRRGGVSRPREGDAERDDRQWA
jgi:hypothetical protein